MLKLWASQLGANTVVVTIETTKLYVAGWYDDAQTYTNTQYKGNKGL